jgi:hypothetical protein
MTSGTSRNLLKNMARQMFASPNTLGPAVETLHDLICNIIKPMKLARTRVNRGIFGRLYVPQQTDIGRKCPRGDLSRRRQSRVERKDRPDVAK